jgi:hypothetical protein
MSFQSRLAERVAEQLRALVRDDHPEAAHAAVKRLASGRSGLSQGDLDRLGAYVATAYLGKMKDEAALSVAEEIIARGGTSASQCHWTAGLAAYRLGNSKMPPITSKPFFRRRKHPAPLRPPRFGAPEAGPAAASRSAS